jgi:histone H3/H4
MEYNFMRSGVGTVTDTLNITNDFKWNMSSLLSVFLEKSIETAITYATHGNRNGITAKDIVLSLKVEVFKFATRDNIYEELNQVKEELQAMSETDTDSSLDSLSSSHGSNSSLHTVGETTDEPDTDSEEFFADPFVVSTCECGICKEINDIENRWVGWTPDTPLEKSLHSAITKTNDTYVST